MMYFTPFWNHVVNFFSAGFLYSKCNRCRQFGNSKCTFVCLPTLLRRSRRKKLRIKEICKKKYSSTVWKFQKSIYSHHFFFFCEINFFVIKFHWLVSQNFLNVGVMFSTLWQEVFKSTIQHSLMTFLGPILNVFCENVCLVFWRKNCL